MSADLEAVYAAVVKLQRRVVKLEKAQPDSTCSKCKAPVYGYFRFCPGCGIDLDAPEADDSICTNRSKL